MSAVIFTRHALLKLKQRGFKKKMILDTIEKPEKFLFRGGEGEAYRRYGKFYLKVVFRISGSAMVVITQHFVKKIK